MLYGGPKGTYEIENKKMDFSAFAFIQKSFALCSHKTILQQEPDWFITDDCAKKQ